ncbi:uncharacterized protein LOC131303096 [Rhododendron vialii]|uniref:uncharacterized protein LOC131303096 n=1 Tax=Rhododendron vialii TaxID=182163 RepID=UPI00265FD201|nr:uncharacterized protein LOC131303096 [Rhododendron vialii]
MILIQAVVGSVILISRRQTRQLIPSSWTNLWREWEPRGLILLSLTAQIVLVGLGNRRKYIAKTWVRTIVWFFYLLADSVATMAIGILSDDIGEVYWNGKNRNPRSSNNQLTAFWASFLLLHLGGMDTITAYSLEDNELWLRHSFSVIAIAGTTTYIMLLSWSYLASKIGMPVGSEIESFDLIQRFARVLNDPESEIAKTLMAMFKVAMARNQPIMEVPVNVNVNLGQSSGCPNHVTELPFSQGVTQRIVGSFLILGVLLMVSLDGALVVKNSSKTDLTTTLVLLIVALILDLCAFGELLLSDQTAHWLIKRGKYSRLENNNHIRTMIPTNWGRKRKRWSKTVEQFNLQWSVDMAFERSVLVWHLATEIRYKLDFIMKPDVTNTPSYFHDRGKCMSRYMLYLLVKHPDMLPIGMGQIKFRDLYSNLADFIEMHTSKSLKDVTEEDAADLLIGLVKDENMVVGGGDMSNSVIFDGCKLAPQLGKYEQEQGKEDVQERIWNVIVFFWMEILGYAASQCKGRQHAQRLRRGEEYLTHLWLLMAHFGLTDHFQIPRSRVVAEAVLR